MSEVPYRSRSEVPRLPPEVEAYSARERERFRALQKMGDHLFSELIGNKDRLVLTEFGQGSYPLVGYKLALVDNYSADQEPVSDPSALVSHLTCNAIVLEFGDSVDAVVLRAENYEKLASQLDSYARIHRDLADTRNRYSNAERSALAGRAEVGLFRAMVDFKQSLEADGLILQEKHLQQLARFMARVEGMPKPVFDNIISVSVDRDTSLSEQEERQLLSLIVEKIGVEPRYVFEESPDDPDYEDEDAGPEFPDEYDPPEPTGSSYLVVPPGTSGVRKRMIMEELPNMLALVKG